MTVAELIEALLVLPQDAEAVVTECWSGGQDFGTPYPHLMGDGRVWVE